MLNDWDRYYLYQASNNIASMYSPRFILLMILFGFGLMLFGPKEDTTAPQPQPIPQEVQR
jgi:hypothetical protein